MSPAPAMPPPSRLPLPRRDYPGHMPVKQAIQALAGAGLRLRIGRGGLFVVRQH